MVVFFLLNNKIKKIFLEGVGGYKNCLPGSVSSGANEFAAHFFYHTKTLFACIAKPYHIIEYGS
jgi:hypothetical protein